MTTIQKGKFFVNGTQICREGDRTLNDDGSLKSESLGFPVLEVSEWITDPETIAKTIVDILNEHWVDG